MLNICILCNSPIPLLDIYTQEKEYLTPTKMWKNYIMNVPECPSMVD